ncbi:MAG: deoxyribodipyrimidine photo-lyase, partial [Anaerolineae bacterium]|nr:deoxyribodipyrimidine photo-lyase [Anaerolineae bacterium]
MMDDRRARALNTMPPRPDGRVVLYWMSRDQRAHDNWALLYAQQWATDLHLPLRVVFTLTPTFLGATERHYEFMLAGLAETEAELRTHRIGFSLLQGDPAAQVARYAQAERAAVVVTDFSPLRLGRQWRAAVAEAAGGAVYEVDAHNVIPAWRVSDKEEFGAYTFRPKVHRLLPDYLTDFPALEDQAIGEPLPAAPDWEAVRRWLQVDTGVGPTPFFIPGPQAGAKALARFLAERLANYAHARNDPTLQGASDLSPYLHYGHLSPQRVALAVNGLRPQYTEGVTAYVEELIVRRELSDNYCLYQPHYDSLAGVKEWARRTLDDHRGDSRPATYTRDQFERAETHDAAWNAAQVEMVQRGKMHNYMRMYWAKKILEWTRSPEEAYEIAVYLNDRYELDGRDPNGYTNIAWSLGGVHVRPWPERPIFGKIRYMAYSGLLKKFDVAAYVRANATA